MSKKLKEFFFILMIVFIAVAGFANNPVINHIYTADAAGLVYNDVFYLYTGHDEPNSSRYTMNDWHAFSSTDMVNWTDHGAVLSYRQFSWASGAAWASQCIERDGKFYWYVCMEHRSGGKAVGVAVGDSPTGPFHDPRGTAIVTNGMTKAASISWDDIDPTVWIEDNGQAYLIWGNTACYWAKLKPNMIELDGPINTFSLPNFTEAPFIHKRNGIYYLSYAAGWPERIEYATSDRITGPWRHRGAIISQTLPSETNHQSIVEYKGNWYFTYHNAALEGGGPYDRSVCIDLLYYNSDGTIKPVVMTSEGVPPVGEAPFKTNTEYKIVAKHSNKLLEVADSSTANAGNVQQYSDNSRANQHWTLNEVGYGVYEIINKNSGLVLDADRSNNNAIQYESWGGVNQKWKLAGTGDGAFFIANLGTNNVVDVIDARTDNGANVQHWPFNGLTCQQWSLVEVNPSTPTPSPSPTPQPNTPVPVTMGDVNHDGTVDIVDALLIAQYYVRLNPDNFDVNAADMNNDNSIDIVDALLVARIYVGLD